MEQKLEQLKLIQMPRLMPGDNNKVFFCSDDVIASCAEFFQCPYEYMYYDAIWFEYAKPVNQCIGDGMLVESVFKGDSFRNNLQNYSGMMLKSLKRESSNDILIDIIEETRKQKPVILIINAYYCPWDYRYHMIHDGGHALLIKAVDEVNGTLKCLDPYYQKGDLLLSFEEFELGQMDVLNVSKLENKPLFQPLEEMIQRVRLSQIIKTESTYMRLSQDIKNHFELEHEINDYNSKEHYSFEDLQKRCPMVENFQVISNNHQRYSVFLRYIGSQQIGIKAEMEDISKQYLDLAKQWDMLRMMLLKYLMLKDENKIKEYISGKLGELQQEEERLMTLTKNVLIGKSTTQMSPKQSKQEEIVHTFTQVNLQPYCNNRGIGSKDSEDADFDDAQVFFMETELLQERQLTVDEIRFQLFGENGYDNIRCKGQQILIPKGKYEYAYLLGCSEWGDYEDKFVFQYEDGVSEVKSIQFSNWTPDVRNHELLEEVAYVGAAVKRYQGVNYVIQNPHRLYMKKIQLLSDRNIIGISFPTIENIHIFSIVMGSK